MPSESVLLRCEELQVAPQPVLDHQSQSLSPCRHFSKNAHLIAVLTKKEKFAAKPLPTGSRAAPDPAPAPAGAAAAAAAAASTANGTATAAPG